MNTILTNFSTSNDDTLLGSLGYITSDFTPSYGIIFILIFVPISWIGLVLFAETYTRIPMDSLLNKDVDVKSTNDKDNDRRPLNLVYKLVIRPSSGTVPVPFVYDTNDLTGIRMRAIFPYRSDYSVLNNVGGFYSQSRYIVGQGLLNVNADTIQLAIAEATIGVNSGGYAAVTVPHEWINVVTVVKVLRGV